MANVNGSATSGNINSNGAGGATTNNQGATMNQNGSNSSTSRLYAVILGGAKVPQLASVFMARTGLVCINPGCPKEGVSEAGHKFCGSCGSQLVEGTVCSSGCGHVPGANALVIRSKDGSTFTVLPICTHCDAELPAIRNDLAARGKWAGALVGALTSKHWTEAAKRAAELTARPKVEKQPAQPAPAPKAEAAPVAAPAPVVVVESKPALTAVQKLEAEKKARQEMRRKDFAVVSAQLSAWLTSNAPAPFVEGIDSKRCAMKHSCCGGGATRYIDMPLVGLCDNAGNAYITVRRELKETFSGLPYLCSSLDLAQKQAEEKAKKAAERVAKAAAEKERVAKAAAEQKDANFKALVEAFKARQLPTREPTKAIKVFAGIAVPGADGVYKPFTLNTFELAAYRQSGEKKEMRRGGEIYIQTFYSFGRYYAANEGKGITLEDALAQCQADCERFTKDPPKPYVARTESFEVTEAAPETLSPEAQAAKDAQRRKREAEREAKRDADRERGKANKGKGGGKGGGGGDKKDKGGKGKGGGKANKSKGGGGGVSSKADFGQMGQEQADKIRLSGGGLGGRQ